MNSNVEPSSLPLMVICTILTTILKDWKLKQ